MKRTAGFTIIEIVVALMIGGVLTSIAVKSVGPLVDRFAVRSARNSFVSMHAKSRALAIERGTATRLHLEAGGDSVWISRDGDFIDSYHFGRRDKVDVQSTPEAIKICMTPRGYAEGSCNTPPDESVTINFHRGNEQSVVKIMPLGQVTF